MANAAAKNLQALKEKSFAIKFDLADTEYTAIETIGSGAYGVVCSAVNNKTNSKVAIKKIPSIFQLNQIAIRTYREIKILRHFKHDNIISIRDILVRGGGEQFQDIYIVLDLMESDLHRIIHSSQPLTEEHTRYFLYQLLRGLKYIHSANVVHRDLKPSNLLINENCDLKIGDFGMARGVASEGPEQDLMMTQYVATRWYRAPELMLLPTAYTAAVDMWSVGCVFAEMLGRRQIFPGTTHTDQLNLIIGILGTPTPEFLKRTHSEMVRNYIKGLGQKKAESLEKLYPRASSPAISLLKTLLVIDPLNRISAESALDHFFLSKYHDSDDEPMCIPLFNFDFEKEAMDKKALRVAITKEVLSFSQNKAKPKTPLTFNFKPVPKSELNKSKGDKKTTGNGFNIAPAKLGPNDQEGPAAIKQTQSLNLLEKLKQDTEGSMKSKTQAAVNDSIFKFKETSGQVGVQSEETRTDVVMVSAKEEGLAVVTETKSQDDVEMLSAKDNQKTEEETPLDAKARIKAALLSTKRKQMLEIRENTRPVTAMQRQREREEKRRKKKERSNARKKRDSKGGQQNGLELSQEDKNLLERWRNMHSTSVSVTTSNDASQASAAVANPPPESLAKNDKQHATMSIGLEKGQVPSDTAANSQLLMESLGMAGSSGLPPSHSDVLMQSGDFNLMQAAGGAHYDAVAGLSTDHHNVKDTGRNPLSPLTNVSLPDSITIQHNPLQTHEYQPTNESSCFNPISMTTHCNTHNNSSIQDSLLTSIPTSSTDRPFQQNKLFLPQQNAESSIPPFNNLDPPGGHLHPFVPDIQVDNVRDTPLRNNEQDSLTVLTRQLMKSHVEDLTLSHTPKGTGVGYGVGLETEVTPSKHTLDNASVRQDSAPLSASLISDWLDVAGNLDDHDLEALQRELELNSPVINQILDFSSMPDS